LFKKKMHAKLLWWHKKPVKKTRCWDTPLMGRSGEKSRVPGLCGWHRKLKIWSKYRWYEFFWGAGLLSQYLTCGL
jgi:hypothetical protein